MQVKGEKARGRSDFILTIPNVHIETAYIKSKRKITDRPYNHTCMSIFQSRNEPEGEVF